MKKQTRLAVVTTAAALLAIGASFTSMAAQKGTWNLEDGEWYCYDSDGDVIEDAFCLSNGKEFYVGDDGRLVRNSWVEVDGSWYYVNSAGEKVVNDWRYTAPAEDDEEGEEWFYLQSNGKRAEGKKMVINGKTHYFNDDGVMLTGWVQESGDSWTAADSNDVSVTDTFYCNEDGARLSNQWIKTYAPGVDADDADEDDKNWYYIRSTGKPAVGKQSSINGQTYFFNAYGEMLSGWVTGTSSNYEEIWSEEGSSMTLSAAAAEGRDIYFCGDEDDGHAKKNRWIKEYNSVDYGADDSDNEKFWFYFDKNGKAFVPTADETVAAQTWTLEDIYAEDGNKVVSLASYEVEGVSFSTDYKSYFIDRERGLVGLMFDERRIGDGCRYVLLGFDGYQLFEVVNQKFDVSFPPDKARATIADDYFYMMVSYEFKAIKLFD